MISLAMDRDFDGTGWTTRETGSGTASATGGVLTCTAAVGEQGMMDYYVPIKPGQRIEFEVEARRVSGEPRINLEIVNYSLSSVTVVDFISVDSTDWRRYRMVYDVPPGTSADWLRIVLGLPTAQSGTGQYFYPTVHVGRAVGSSLVLARGLLSLASGTTGYHANFPYFGIASLAYSAPDTLVVTLDHTLLSTIAQRPNVQLTGTQANVLIPVLGTITDGATPTIDIQWTDGTTCPVNISAELVYVSMLVTL